MYLLNNIKQMSGLRVKLLISAAVLLFFPLGTQAAVCDQDSILNFVARDSGGTFVSGARVDVYKQEVDANGQSKPGNRVAGGTTDSVLGRVRLNWRNSEVSSAAYAIRVQTIYKDNASFWYYDNEISCGQEKSLEETLSGLSFVLREADGSPLTNVGFNIYSQLRDTNGSLVNAKNELLTNLNSGSSGVVKAYLPQGSVRSRDRNQVDHYVMEISRGSLRSYLYNLYVSDGQMNTVNFYLSRFRLQLKDYLGRSAIGAKVEVYRQEDDISNQAKKGDRVGEFTIGADGYGYIELSPATYVLGVKGENNEYQYFWDVVVGNSQTSDQRLSLSSNFNSSGTCPAAANLNITLLTGAKIAASGLKYEVYEQTVDSSGLPLAGARVGSGTTDSSGRGKINFKPSSQKSYLIKVWDKQANLGEYWFYDAAKFVCGYDRNVTKTVPLLKVIWRDSAGELKRNFNFSLWAQQYDADGKPILANNGRIGDFKTDAGGQAYIYVAPYNSYSSGQTGTYALTAKDGSGNTVTFYDIYPTEDKDTVFTAQLSGLSGQVKDARGRIQANKEVKLYSVDNQQLGAILMRAKTDASGQFNLEYPAGTYALGVPDDFNQDSIFWNIVVKPGSSSQKLSLNLTNISISSAGSEELPNEPTIRLYSLVGTNSAGYFRDKEVASLRLNSGKTALKSLAAGPYLAVYTGQGNREYGIAFYASAGQFQNVSLQIASKHLISAGQNYRLNVPSNVSSSPSNSSSPGGSSLSSTVKGRILLQVEDKGQAWYVNPVDNKRYYLGRPQDAFSVMQKLGLGISNKDFSALQATPSRFKLQAGRILIKVEDKGKAYYFDPVKLELHYLGRPQDAFNVMRQLGLGITNSNLGKIVSDR